MTKEKIWSPELMIHRARSLGRLVVEIETGAKELEGSILAAPVLLSLAAEIALKAWQCRERNGPPDQTHNLLKLFDGLSNNAQSRLEGKMPEIGNPLPGMPAIYPGMRNALFQCSSVFVEWRYSYEHQSLWAETGVLKTALAAIVEAYDDSHQGLTSDT